MNPQAPITMYQYFGSRVCDPRHSCGATRCGSQTRDPKVALSNGDSLVLGDWCLVISEWLPNMDLNHDKQIQSLLCYRYTIRQFGDGQGTSLWSPVKEGEP